MKRGLIALIAIMVCAGTASAQLCSLDDPSIVASQANPLKVRPGDSLQVIVQVYAPEGVESATARFNYEKGSDDVAMVLSASAPGSQYSYSANWIVHDTLDQTWYTTELFVRTRGGRELVSEVSWQDPTVSHNASQIIPGSFQPGTYVFPQEVQAGNFTCVNGNCVSGSDVDAATLSGSAPGLTAGSASSTAWSGITGIPAGFADGVDNTGSFSESDPQVGNTQSQRVCVGSGSQVECSNSLLTWTGSRLGLYTSSPGYTLDVRGNAYVRDSLRVNNRQVPFSFVYGGCNSPSCVRSCPGGMTIAWAYGFHGFWASQVGAGGWVCGGAIEWKGNCVGSSSCSVSTGCGTSGLFLACW